MSKIRRSGVLFGAVFIYALTAGIIPDVFAKKKQRTVPEDKRIELQDGGPYQGEWQAKDLTFTYEYTKEPGRIAINGEVKFKRAKRLDTFTLEANLIDTEGHVLHRQRIGIAGGRREIQVVPTKAEIKAPEGTWGVAFSYSGTTRGIGEGAGSPNQFWLTPW